MSHFNATTDGQKLEAQKLEKIMKSPKSDFTDIAEMQSSVCSLDQLSPNQLLGARSNVQNQLKKAKYDYIELLKEELRKAKTTTFAELPHITVSQHQNLAAFQLQVKGHICMFIEKRWEREERAEMLKEN
ncbi:hypothetical protein M409DRAFT_17645 [Zasmidium cellare ATCC 36951]|uniref:Uncharacterized protein n=1 Tax=Zasmidium cellare ATCC 36951 TaxID=1080233 RepID=A0A6A6D2L4_ZASCE|nr:uncharacterized protein M409DRAFT_17645 [Zasmidium cellare ATCC 36951]KAF2172412.1 hypothetical protein M409DRAFT_17645 [Zasmidium cellare ATCC 36951]